VRNPVNMPDFLYLGAAKSASTWMFRSLKAHPQVFVPPAKEIFYFDRQYHRGLKWYQSFFAAEGAANRRIGDISTSYFYSDAAAERIRATLPGAKLFACVRNPILRAWSSYLFKRRNAKTSADFATALADDPAMCRLGLYSEHIVRYRNLFPAERLKVFVYDDLKQDPVQFGRELYSFLDVDPTFVNPFAHQRVLAASRPRSTAAAALAKRAARWARKLGFANFVGRVKSSRVVTGALFVPLEEASRERIPREAWDRLADYFAEDVDRVSKLLGRDLSHWLTPPLADASGPASG